MNSILSFLPHEEHIRAAPDFQLSSSESNLLITLLNQEDQHQYNELLNISLPIHVQQLSHELSLLLHLSSSTTWMITILLKQLIIQKHSLDLLTVVACVTLSFKYQQLSSQTIDYELIAKCCQIDNIQHIHDAEVDLLDIFSYDISVTTPDHFFSYLSNVNNNLKEIVEQVQSLLSISSYSHETYQLLHNYPCSIVVLSLMYTITSNTFTTEQIKNFVTHKKDAVHYSDQLLNCITQIQNIFSSC
ncbi:unnamed protein product [Adineta steineri]|uniref:Cyclin N-terminal domain-containing protein n=1 Tax=Adineta steineri TaxID=433720 RepID=A0A815GXD0_9BILA|nr:unnamed protein product [Adineta steineri]CAF1594253.1 unnamed protein product [Adineta steineri]